MSLLYILGANMNNALCLVPTSSIPKTRFSHCTAGFFPVQITRFDDATTDMYNTRPQWAKNGKNNAIRNCWISVRRGNKIAPLWHKCIIGAILLPLKHFRVAHFDKALCQSTSDFQISNIFEKLRSFCIEEIFTINF